MKTWKFSHIALFNDFQIQNNFPIAFVISCISKMFVLILHISHTHKHKRVNWNCDAHYCNFSYFIFFPFHYNIKYWPWVEENFFSYWMYWMKKNMMQRETFIYFTLCVHLHKNLMFPVSDDWCLVNVDDCENFRVFVREMLRVFLVDLFNYEWKSVQVWRWMIKVMSRQFLNFEKFKDYKVKFTIRIPTFG